MDRKESNNYLKLAYIVVEIVADALREVFKHEWDSLYSKKKTPWKDDPVSLANFKAMAIPRGSPPKSTAWNSYNNLTNGDRKTWDITKLCYVLIFSKPLNLKVNKPLEYGAVDTLRDIRNTVLHKEKAEITDADFIKICNEVKTELTTFGATCHCHLKEIKTIEQKVLPKDVIKKLKKERDMARQEYIEQRKQKKRQLIYSFGIIFGLTILIGFIIYHLVPSKVPSYFPENTSRDVVGKQAEIDLSVGAILSGTRLVALYGLQGIGKRTTAIAVGQKLLQKWIPFPWISITYVNLRGVKDTSTLQTRILESFFIFTKLNVSFPLKELLTNIIKRQTVIILDRLQELFESEIRHEAKEFIIDMLDWNQNIAFLLVHNKMIDSAKYQIKTITLKPLSKPDSVLLLRAISDTKYAAVENAVVNFCRGIPILLMLYGKVIKHKVLSDETLTDIIDSVPMNKQDVDDEQITRSIRVLTDKLSRTHQELLIFMSFSVDTVSVDTLRDTFPDSDETVFELLDMGLLELVSVRENKVRYIGPIRESCTNVRNGTLQLCKELEIKFLKQYMSVASRLGSSLYEKNFKKDTVFQMLIEEGLNIKVMFEIGSRRSYASDTFFQMLVRTSAYFTFALSHTAFTRYDYYKSALIFKNYDTSKFLNLLYAQSDRGDIYSFNHNDDFVKYYMLVNESIQLFEKEHVCGENILSRENGICYLVYGKVIGLNLTAVMKSKQFEKVYDPYRGLALVGEAINMFTSLEMKHELAEGLSCRGLILRTLGDFKGSAREYERSLSILTELYGDHPFVAASYFNSAFSYYKMGGFNLLKASSMFNVSYTLFSSTIGVHRRTAKALFMVGSCLQSIGKYQASKTIISKAYTIQNEVVTLHTDLMKAPRDKAESLYMNYLVAQAIPTAERQLQLWRINDEINIKSSFITYFIANCQRSLDQIEVAYENYDLAQQKLSLICQNDTAICEFYSILKEDIKQIKNESRYGEERKDFNSALTVLSEVFRTVVYFTLCIGIVLLLSLLFLYICYMRNEDYFDLFQNF